MLQPGRFDNISFRRLKCRANGPVSLHSFPWLQVLSKKCFEEGFPIGESGKSLYFPGRGEKMSRSAVTGQAGAKNCPIPGFYRPGPACLWKKMTCRAGRNGCRREVGSAAGGRLDPGPEPRTERRPKQWWEAAKRILCYVSICGILTSYKSQGIDGAGLRKAGADRCRTAQKQRRDPWNPDTNGSC